jgi:hypothetical protein
VSHEAVRHEIPPIGISRRGLPGPWAHPSTLGCGPTEITPLSPLPNGGPRRNRRSFAAICALPLSPVSNGDRRRESFVGLPLSPFANGGAWRNRRSFTAICALPLSPVSNGDRRRDGKECKRALARPFKGVKEIMVGTSIRVCARTANTRGQRPAPRCGLIVYDLALRVRRTSRGARCPRWLTATNCPQVIGTQVQYIVP